MRNSDPRMRILSFQKPDSDLNSMHTVQITGRDFQYGSDFYISLNRSSWLCWSIISWKSVFMTFHCTKCVKTPVSFVMKYCPTSITCIDPASLQKLFALLSGESNLIRSSNRCNKTFWCDGMSFCLLRKIDCPINTSGCPDLSWCVSNSAHMFATVP